MRPIVRLICTCAALFASFSPVLADEWTETGDAGELLDTAQQPEGSGPLTRISGTLANGFDIDMFVIQITEPEIFRATTTGGDGVGDPFDAALALFDSDGFGRYFNNDISSAVFDARLRADSTEGPVPEGTYYLALYDQSWAPLSGDASSRDDIIFPVFDFFVSHHGPTGPGGHLPLVAWGNEGTEVFNNAPYAITLEGASFVPDPESDPVPARLGNLSTRGDVGVGDNVLIGGLIIEGTEPKQVVIRARGPSIAAVAPELTGLLGDPTLELFTGPLPADFNDNWATHPNAGSIPATLVPTDEREAVIVTTLDPGPHTAIVRGAGGSTGIGIVEIFEVDDTGDVRMINVSTRGHVGAGDSVLIGGVIITGDESATVTVRARGPSIADAVPDLSGQILSNPVLQLYAQDGSLIDSNDRWADDASATDTPEDLRVTHAEEAVLTRSLEPGAYTAIVSGVGGATGIGIVEIFEVR